MLLGHVVDNTSKITHPKTSRSDLAASNSERPPLRITRPQRRFKRRWLLPILVPNEPTLGPTEDALFDKEPQWLRLNQ